MSKAILVILVVWMHTGSLGLQIKSNVNCSLTQLTTLLQTDVLLTLEEKENFVSLQTTTVIISLLGQSLTRLKEGESN